MSHIRCWSPSELDWLWVATRWTCGSPLHRHSAANFATLCGSMLWLYPSFNEMMTETAILTLYHWETLSPKLSMPQMWATLLFNSFGTMVMVLPRSHYYHIYSQDYHIFSCFVNTALILYSSQNGSYLWIYHDYPSLGQIKPNLTNTDWNSVSASLDNLLAAQSCSFAGAVVGWLSCRGFFSSSFLSYIILFSSDFLPFHTHIQFPYLYLSVSCSMEIFG